MTTMTAPQSVNVDRDRLLQMRAGMIRAIREIDAALGIRGTFSKE